MFWMFLEERDVCNGYDYTESDLDITTGIYIVSMMYQTSIFLKYIIIMNISKFLLLIHICIVQSGILF